MKASILVQKAKILFFFFPHENQLGNTMLIKCFFQVCTAYTELEFKLE